MTSRRCWVIIDIPMVIRNIPMVLIDTSIEVPVDTVTLPKPSNRNFVKDTSDFDCR